ncbi:hypothetical protein ACYSNX_11190 [Myroides sp. LJL115]
MKKMFKSLFLPLAVFAMLGLGALTLSASNVTNDVVTEAEFTSDNFAQTPYTGIVYYEISPLVYTEAIGVTADHCSLDEGDEMCYIEINNVLTQAYGKDSLGVIRPLFELD